MIDKCRYVEVLFIEYLSSKFQNDFCTTIVYFMLCCYNFLNEFEGKIYGSYYYVNHTSSVTAEA
jgi:hypothetical protein